MLIRQLGIPPQTVAIVLWLSRRRRQKQSEAAVSKVTHQSPGSPSPLVNPHTVAADRNFVPLPTDLCRTLPSFRTPFLVNKLPRFSTANFTRQRTEAPRPVGGGAETCPRTPRRSLRPLRGPVPDLAMRIGPAAASLRGPRVRQGEEKRRSRLVFGEPRARGDSGRRATSDCPGLGPG